MLTAEPAPLDRLEAHTERLGAFEKRNGEFKTSTTASDY